MSRSRGVRTAQERPRAGRLRRASTVLCAAALLGTGLFAVEAAAPAPPPVGGGKKIASPSGTDVVARVNGQPILRRDFDLAVQIQFSGRRAPVGLQELQGARDQVLERLIENELLYQKAVTGASPVSDKDVDEELARVRGTFASPEVFAQVLEKNGVSESEFKKQIRRTLMVTRFVDRQVTADVQVSDEDVKRYYDQNPAEMARKEAVHLAQILVRVAPDATPESRAAARQKIEAILKEVRSGGDFADLARKHSDGRDAQNGGDTGWMARGKGPPALEKSAFALQAGQTSDVVESRLGFHLLKVLDRRPEGAIPFEEVKNTIRRRLIAREREAKIRAYVDHLKEQARVERLAKAAP